MAKIKLIATDMDGTFMTQAGQIHPDNIAAVAEAQAAGIAVVPATMRNLPFGRKLFEQSDFSGHSILCNGGAICDRDDSVLYSAAIAPDLLYRILRIFESVKYSIRVLTAGKILISSPSFAGSETNLRGPNNDWDYEGYDDLEALVKAVEKEALLVSLNPLAATNAPEDFVEYLEAETQGQLTITSSKPKVLEIMARGVNKGYALARLAELLGLGREEVMAIGDSYNDIPMIQWAGVGIVVGNAEQAVKDAADYITASNDEAGAAKAIRKYAL